MSILTENERLSIMKAYNDRNSVEWHLREMKEIAAIILREATRLLHEEQNRLKESYLKIGDVAKTFTSRKNGLATLVKCAGSVSKDFDSLQYQSQNHAIIPEEWEDMRLSILTICGYAHELHEQSLNSLAEKLANEYNAVVTKFKEKYAKQPPRINEISYQDIENTGSKINGLFSGKLQQVA